MDNLVSGYLVGWKRERGAAYRDTTMIRSRTPTSERLGGSSTGEYQRTRVGGKSIATFASWDGTKISLAPV